MGTTQNCMPTKSQENLLKAALLDGDEALEAWNAWRTETNLADIDYGTQRMLPLLYMNLQRMGIQDTLLTQFKGVYRRCWVSNNLLFKNAASFIRLLHASNISTMIFKGAGLILLLDLNLALRPMDDMDILIPQESVSQVITFLQELGWQPKHPQENSFNPTKHAIAWTDGKGNNIDLHWFSLDHLMAGKFEPGYWSRSLQNNLYSIPVQVMDATDQLIHTCVHGIRWNPVPSFRWVSDAIMLIRNSKYPIQWDYLTEHACQRHLTLPLSDGLRYLKDSFNIPIPEDVLQQLSDIPVSAQEKRFYHRLTHKPLPILGAAVLLTDQYQIKFKDQFAFPGFLRYLQRRMELTHLWELPPILLYRLWRRILIDVFNKEYEKLPLSPSWQTHSQNNK